MNLSLAADALKEMAQVLGLTERSIASVAKRFQADMRSLAVIGMTGTSSILADMRAIVKGAIGDAYVAGLKQGGVSFDEMGDDDATMMIELSDAQLAFVTDFVKAIRESRTDKALQREILDTRIPLWTASVEAAGAYGLASANGRMMGTWVLGKTEEHCEKTGDTMGCLQLNGQRHSLKWFTSHGYIPRQPGNKFITCGGWACDCSIVDDNGKKLM